MSDPTQDRIAEIVKSNNIVLFMKGTKMMPMCGFSARAVQILATYTTDFQTVNVLQDPEIRQGIKTYSNWPTIPQTYINGEFLGGSDILVEMHEAGELAMKIGGGEAASEA